MTRMEIDTAEHLGRERPLRDVAVLWGAALAVYVTVAIARVGWAMAGGGDVGMGDPLVEAPAMLVATVVVVRLASRLRPGPGHGLGLVAPARRWWAIGVVACLVCTAATALVGMLVVLARGVPEQAAGVRWGEVGVGALGRAVLLAVVLGPLIEEILYRGVLQRALAHRLGIRVALPVTAVVFALLHLPDMGLGHVTAGLLYGWLYHRSGSLWLAIVVHSLDNAVAIAVHAWLVGYV